MQNADPAYDSSRCTTAKQLRQLGLPLPAEIPDPAWVYNKNISTEEEKVSTDDEPRAHVVTINTPLFRHANKRYNIVNGKIVVNVLKVEADGERTQQSRYRRDRKYPPFH